MHYGKFYLRAIRLWLIEMMRAGPVASIAIWDEARSEQISRNAVLEVLNSGGFRKVRVGFGRGGHWAWELAAFSTPILSPSRAQDPTGGEF